MSVSKLDSNGDWTFGQGLSNYANGSNEISQNVITRIKSFQNDWFLDSTACIDWFNLLSNRNTQKSTEAQISKTVLDTKGVSTLDSLNFVLDRQNRKASIDLVYTDIFGNEQEISAGV